MKKVTVIIACYNASAWVKDAFSSIKNQTMPLDDIECILVDDASDDNDATWQVLLEIEKEAPESVMVIHLDENMRQGGARNIAMQYMTGKYMLFLDADDLYRPETCQELYELAEKNKTDIIHFQHEIVWRSMEDKSIPQRKPDSEGIICDMEEHPNLKEMLLTGQLGDFGCTNKFYSTDLIRKVGSTFAERLVYEEPKFVYPLFLHIKRYIVIETKYYIYRKHADSTMNSELGIRLLDHPNSQLQLMEFVMKDREMYERFKEEIDYHFAFSFLYETLSFSVRNKGILPLDYFEKMSEVFNLLVPDILSNKYVNNCEYVRMAVEGSKKRYINQQELNTFAYEVANCYYMVSKESG